MKRALSVILLAVLMLTTVGCDGGSMNFVGNLFGTQQDEVVESYWNSAQDMIDIGNYEEAAKILQEGVEQTGSEELVELLERVNGLIQNEQQALSAPQADLLGMNDAQYRLNVFLTNFSETKFYAYPCSDYEMLRFVREHCYYNNDGSVTTQNDILYKYFAVTLSEGTADRDYYNDDQTKSVRYSNQKYSYQTTPYAYNGYVAFAKSMQQDSYGYYTVEYDVYFVDSGYRSEYEEFYRMNASEAQSHTHLSYAYSGEAVVQDYTRTNGKESYQLITLKITSTPKVFSEPAATYAPVTQTTGEVNLSSVQKRINVFLSNFTETFFDTYPCTKYEMVSFAYSHARINNDGKVHYGSWEYYISETDVNNILNKYFGVTYPQNGAEDVLSYSTQYGTQTIRYDGDYYYFPAADGGGHSYVSIAKEMVRNSDGSYTVKYDAYSLVDFWEDDTNNYYGYSAEQARNSIKLEYMYSGTARVKDYTRTNGVQSYQLIEMTRN